MTDTTPTTPQMAFAQFVRQTVEDAREQHGWTVGDIARHTGISRSTLFRWLAGDWQRYPELSKVRSLCATLGLPIAAAIRPLAMAGTPAPASPPALTQVEADMGSIRERLLDETVPASDKRQIRALLHRLARRDVPLNARPSSTPQVAHRNAPPQPRASRL